MTAKVARQCLRCGIALDTSGARGLCLSCLSLTTTHRFTSGDSEEVVEDLKLQEGVAVGPQDRFLLHDRLGAGGMGEVWLATDQELSREGDPYWVALKFLSETIRNNKQALAAVRTEVIRSQELNHSNIVRVFDLHTTKKGMPFIKMEYVKGNNLVYWLEDCPNGVMNWREVVEIARQLCGALQYAHEVAGVIHRDIKPGNLLLRTDRILKVADFGIAEALFTTHAASLKQKALGTIWYASPQQLLGQRPSPADDIHALGATLYELLTGEPPFMGHTDHTEGDSAEALIHQVRYETPEPIKQRLARREIENEIPAKLVTLIHRCLEKDAQARPLAREVMSLLPTPGMQSAAQVAAPAPRKVRPIPEERWEAPPVVEEKGHRLVRWIAYAALTAISAVVSYLIVTAAPPPPTPVNPPKRTNAVAAAPQETIHEDTPSESPVVPPASVGTALPTKTGLLALDFQNFRDRPYPRTVTLKRLDGTVVVSNSPAIRHTVPVGDYEVIMTEKLVSDSWEMFTRTRVSEERPVRVTLKYDRKRIELRSNIPGLVIGWPAGLSQDSSSGNAGETAFLPMGRFRVTGFKAGWTQESRDQYVTLTPETREIYVKMVASLSPHAGEISWTNSIGMRLNEIKTMPGIWAAVTETRLVDFEQFVNENGFDEKLGMHTVTENGVLPSPDFSWRKPPGGFSNDPQLPVIGVNWLDATKFCEWLTKRERERGILKDRERYRLPRTNEWVELAGRQKYPWGENIQTLQRKGEFAGNYSGAEVAGSPGWPVSWLYLKDYNDGFPRTAPPLERYAGHFGLIHMGGNVAEWSEEQMLCGGSWADGADGKEANDFDYLATTSFQMIPTEQRRDTVGFRVLLETADKQPVL